MASGPARIAINWREVFGATSSSPVREVEVCSASPSSSSPRDGAPAKGARARARGDARPSDGDDDEKRRGTPRRRFGALSDELGRRGGGQRSPGAATGGVGARRPVTRAATKAAADRRPGTCSAATDAYAFNGDDEMVDVGHKYNQSSPAFRGKKNYGPLNLVKHKSRGRVGQGNPIPVDKMYQQRVHASVPEESDKGKRRQSEKLSSSRFNKRRKGQLQDSSPLNSQKVQDVVVLDDEDAQTEGKVNYEISDRRNEPKIYYPSRDDPEAVELTSSDISCLEPGAFLSSPVINYYIQNIKRTRLNREDCRDKFYIFNTYFYGKLEEALFRLGDISKLRRWWKGVNIFHRSYIILPIHGRSHWSLVIICMPAKESSSGPIVLHLDSLEMHRSDKILDAVGRYLEEEWQHLKNNPSPDTSVSEIMWEDLSSNIQKQAVQVPQQTNAYDCGIFMLYYIERFIREAPERLMVDKLDMFKYSWFKPELASELRQRIRNLLLEEFESAKLDDAMSDPAASNGSDIENNIKGGELEADAPSDSAEMLVELGEGIKAAASAEGCGGSGDEGIKVAESEEASGESEDAGKSIEGINVAESEGASGESGDAGKIMEGYGAESEEESGEPGDAGKSMEGYVAESEEESGEPGDAVKIMEGYVAESEEESGDPGDAGRSIKGINVAEPEEASGESGHAGKCFEVVNVAESDEASEEFGYAGKIKKCFKVAASKEASVESVSTDKSMEGISKGAASDEAPTSSGNRGEKTTGCAASEADSDSSDTEKEGLMAIVSQESPKNNEGVIAGTSMPDVLCDSCSLKNKWAVPSTPIPDVVCDSCDSDTGAKIEISRVHRRTNRGMISICLE